MDWYLSDLLKGIEGGGIRKRSSVLLLVSLLAPPPEAACALPEWMCMSSCANLSHSDTTLLPVDDTVDTVFKLGPLFSESTSVAALLTEVDRVLVGCPLA